MRTRSYNKWLLVCSAGMVLMYCFHRFISQKINFVIYSNGYFQISDYAYHIILVKKFWFNGFGNIYDLSFQQRAISDYIGSPIYTVMPLGITPVAMIVWLPFSYLSQFSMALSYTLWMAFSSGALAAGLWRVGRLVGRSKTEHMLPLALILCTLFSVTTKSAVLLGQTSILATGLLVYLMGLLHQSNRETRAIHVLLIGLFILILGMKPPYLALGLGLLLIYGRWQQFFYSSILVIIVMAGMTPVLSLKWLSSYLNLLEMYSWKDIPNAYAWSVKLETMNIFRSAFKDIIGDGVAGFISNTVYGLVYLIVIGFSFFSGIYGQSIEQLSKFRVSKEQLYILLVAGYLLFAPNAGGYEDVLFISVFVVVMLVGDSPKLIDYKSLGLFLMLFLILTHNSFSHNKPIWLFWILKSIIVGYMFTFCRFQHVEENSNAIHKIQKRNNPLFPE